MLAQVYYVFIQLVKFIHVSYHAATFRSSEEVSNKGIELLKETFTNLGPRLQVSWFTCF